MIHSLRCLTIAAVFAVLGYASLRGESAVALRISPAISYAPATIRFTVIIEPNARNRQACLDYDGGEAGSSCWDIDGTTPRTQWFTRHIGSAGEYFAVVRVLQLSATGESRILSTGARPFQVLDPGVPFVR